jgi:restriction system protein
MEGPEGAEAFSPDIHHEQLEALERAFFRSGAKVVLLFGSEGVGKTALACLFAELHRDRFPGGTHIITVHSELDEAEVLDRLAGEESALLVLDEAERLPMYRLAPLVHRIREARPLASVLMTGRGPFFVDDDSIAIQIPPLNVMQMIDLLTRRTGLSRQRFERLVDVLGGSAATAGTVATLLVQGVATEQVVGWLEGGALASALDPSGLELFGKSPRRAGLDLVIEEVSESLIKELADRPELLHQLQPRKFEELVAELYRRRGFEVTLTPASGDEGVDVYVVSRNDLGRTLWVVQAKRYAANRPIEAGVVRELYGTVMAQEASAGILITTSFFQPGAKDLERKYEYRLSLKDYLDLQAMLRGAPPDSNAR